MGDVVKTVELPRLLLLPFTGSVITNVVRDLAKYDRNWIHPEITGDNFPWGNCFDACKIVFLDFDRAEVSSKEVLSAARYLNLEQPSYEHALRFGLQCPHEHQLSKHLLVFLHEPWTDRFGRKLVIALTRHESRRGIWLREPISGKWGPFTRFAFLSPLFLFIKIIYP